MKLDPSRREHWDRVYRTRGARDVSWYQPRPEVSLALIAASGVARDSGIVDVGGGASSLTACLLDDGYSRLAVLDVSGEALRHARSLLGARAADVEWIEADVTSFAPPRRFGLWHDRAVFHFLTEPGDRRAYAASLRRALQPDGAVVLATFAPDGPPTCSGLAVARHDEASILAALGDDFRLEETRRETHVTPWRSEQRFLYVRLRWQS